MSNRPGADARQGERQHEAPQHRKTSGAERTGRLDQAVVDGLQREVAGEDHVGQIGVHETHDDRRIGEHEVERYEIGEQSADQLLDHPVAAEHHGPREHPHQRVAPEGEDDEQEQRLAPPPTDRLGEQPGAGEAEDEAVERHLRAEAEGAQHQGPVELLLEERGVAREGRLRDAPAERHVAQEAEVEHGGEGQEDGHGQPEIGRPDKGGYEPGPHGSSNPVAGTPDHRGGGTPGRWAPRPGGGSGSPGVPPAATDTGPAPRLWAGRSCSPNARPSSRIGPATIPPRGAVRAPDAEGVGYSRR